MIHRCEASCPGPFSLSVSKDEGKTSILAFECYAIPPLGAEITFTTPEGVAHHYKIERVILQMPELTGSEGPAAYFAETCSEATLYVTEV